MFIHFRSMSVSDVSQFMLHLNSFDRFEPSWSWCSIVPPSIKALSVVPKEGCAQILAFAGFLELVVNKKTSEPGGIHAFRLAWVCLPLDIFLRQLWKGQPRPWPDRLRQLRPGSCDKDLPIYMTTVHGCTWYYMQVCTFCCLCFWSSHVFEHVSISTWCLIFFC